ncbi:MAG: hypothetical protein EBT07_15485, partial [Actinobacteria bacterium]|nr:hypothetical protein [Actinomycetota bacterium]
MQNPIDPDKVALHPGLMEFPHHVGSAVIKPEDRGKIKSKALTAMQEQTHTQLRQLQQQMELLRSQAMEIRNPISNGQFGSLPLRTQSMKFCMWPLGFVFVVPTRSEPCGRLTFCGQ